MSKDIIPLDWKAIRRAVLENIQSGQWKPGDKIPREIELAAAYGCTRSTVGRALRDLATAGFLERRRKGGTFISANPTRKAPLDVPILRDAIRSAGYEPGYRLVSAATVAAPCEITADLGLAPGSTLLHIRALYLADGAPCQLEDRWLVPSMVRGLGADPWEAQPVDEWLLRNAPLTRAKIVIDAIALPADLANLLDQPTHSPSLRVARTSWGLSRPIGVLLLYHGAGYQLKTGI